MLEAVPVVDRLAQLLKALHFPVATAIHMPWTHQQYALDPYALALRAQYSFEFRCTGDQQGAGDSLAIYSLVAYIGLAKIEQCDEQ